MLLEQTSKTGVWDIQAGETSLPTITLNNLAANSIIKVTLQFFGRAQSDNLSEGYTYSIREKGTNLITLSPSFGLVQGQDSWQLFTHQVLFQVPGNVNDGQAGIFIDIGEGDMNGVGSMMNFTLFAEKVKS